MKQNYTIAMLDILGFSQMVQRHPLDNVVDIALGRLRQAMCHAINKDSWPDTKPTLEEINRNSLIGIAWFSDTILFWTKDDCDENLRELIQTVAWLMFVNIQGHTKLRGGIAYGEAFIDSANSLFVGTPIIDAHRMEAQQQWSGVALTKSAVERTPQIYRDGRFGDWPLVPYEVPLRDASTLATLAVNWTYGIHSDFDMRWSSNSDEPTDYDWETNRSICEKWKNTRQFHADVCSQCSRTKRCT